MFGENLHDLAVCDNTIKESFNGETVQFMVQRINALKEGDSSKRRFFPLSPDL